MLTSQLPLIKEESKQEDLMSVNTPNKASIKTGADNTAQIETFPYSNLDSNNRLYKFWPGKNRFLLKGYLMTGPLDDCGPCMYNWVCLLGISAVYAALVCPRLVSGVLIIVPIININLFLLTVLFLLLTAFTDPGIIPRREFFEIDGRVPYPYEFSLGEDEESQPASNSEEAAIKFASEKQEFERYFTFCKTCRIYRPQRAAHCNECDNCVEVHDHHCPFVNNCVGKRNYRYFMGFIWCVSLLAMSEMIGVLLLIIGAVQDKKDNKDNKEQEDTSRTIALALGIPTAFFAISIAAFCGWNIYLLCTRRTTREILKKKPRAVDFKDFKRPEPNWLRLDPTMFNASRPLTNNQSANLRAAFGAHH